MMNALIIVQCFIENLFKFFKQIFFSLLLSCGMRKRFFSGRFLSFYELFFIVVKFNCYRAAVKEKVVKKCICLKVGNGRFDSCQIF